jgi:hypothetical protein
MATSLVNYEPKVLPSEKEEHGSYDDAKAQWTIGTHPTTVPTEAKEHPDDP